MRAMTKNVVTITILHIMLDDTMARFVGRCDTIDNTASEYLPNRYAMVR